MPLPALVAGAAADVRGTLVAVHFRDERGFAIFSLEQPDGSRVRALGQLPAEMTLQTVIRVGGIWTRHAEFGWQELVQQQTALGQQQTHGAETRVEEKVPQFLPQLQRIKPTQQGSRRSDSSSNGTF